MFSQHIVDEDTIYSSNEILYILILEFRFKKSKLLQPKSNVTILFYRGEFKSIVIQ
jgi:hypothetical protein